ncbi:MAG: HAD-IA family hydrolase [Myxococcaceae bacterium]
MTFPKAAIFDLDGVVLSTQLIHAKAWTRTFNEALRYLSDEERTLSGDGTLKLTGAFDPSSSYGPFTHQDYLDHVDGKDRCVGADCFFKARGLELQWGAEQDHWSASSPTGLSVAGVCRRKNELVVEMFDRPKGDDEKIVPFESTLERIHELRARGVKIGAASSSKNATKVLELAGVLGLFDTVVCGLDITDAKTQSKPSPFLFLEAAKRLGVKAHEAMIVEDAQCGVQAGRDGGFKLVVGLARDPENTSKLAEFADVVVPDLKEMGVEQIASRCAAPSRSQVHPWELQFASFDPAAERVTEVLTALGNGYMGQRSSLSALGLGPTGEPGFYVAGVFNKLHGKTDDLVNLPGWAALRLFDGLDWVDLTQGKVLGYSRRLDLKCGELSIELTWRSPHGRQTRVGVRQFFSHDDEHVGAVRFALEPLNYRGVLVAESSAGGAATNAGEVHLDTTAGGCDPEARTHHLEVTTNGSGVRVRQAVRLDLHAAAGVRALDPTLPAAPGLRLELPAAPGEPVTVDKVALVSTSRPGDRLLEAKDVEGLAGYDELARENHAEWQRHWQRSDVVIDGAPRDQQAIRFATYHLSSLGHRAGGTTSIAAKGLSNLPGGGYRGHVFWDTELFMLQFFVFTAPEAARQLLLYRYHTLPEARAKAKRLGYQGALYAWESTGRGGEETPHSVGGCRVWCGETEHHISSAVAYGVDQYLRVTGDEDFARRHGAEILLETARFWASRATRAPGGSGYEIHTVIGPDEFHEGPGRAEGGVDNSVYTNALAGWNIRRAIEVLDALAPGHKDAVLARVGLSGGYPAWRAAALEIAAGLKVNFDPHSKLFEQFDGYFGLLDPLQCEYTPEWIRPDGRFVSQAMDGYLLKAGRADRASWTQINKQADVVMMLHLLDGSYDPEVVKRNFEYYAPRTSHGSSLSNAIHAIMAVRLGDEAAASRYLEEALGTDLGDEKGNSSGGIHAAALGGAWQAVVNGFGGVSVRGERLRVAPALHGAWKRLSFRIVYRGVPLEVRATPEAVEVEALTGDFAPLTLEVHGQELVLSRRGAVRVTCLPAGGQSLRQTG